MTAVFFPTADMEDATVLGRGFFLMEHFQERIRVAVQNAIAGAFKADG